MKQTLTDFVLLKKFTYLPRFTLKKPYVTLKKPYITLKTYYNLFKKLPEKSKELHDIDKNFVFRYISHLSKDLIQSTRGKSSFPCFSLFNI